ncbi:MAG: hypothetical protein ACYTBJ_20420 [Planctomycetota bacterium]|jgi:hypothetical protein
MTDKILAVGAVEVIIILGFVSVLIVVFFMYLARSNKERQKLRLELDKLGEELEQARKLAEQSKKRKPPAGSR